jgi:hypothetical protein
MIDSWTLRTKLLHPLSRAIDEMEAAGASIPDMLDAFENMTATLRQEVDYLARQKQ